MARTRKDPPPTLVRYIELGPTTIWFAKQKNGCTVKFIINDSLQDGYVIVQSNIYRSPVEYPAFPMEEIVKVMAFPNFDTAFIGYECSTDTFENLKALGNFVEVLSK